MPNTVSGGGDARPSAPGVPASTEDVYGLTVPVAADVADVPRDFTNLARDVITQLDLRLTESSARNSYQSKIVVRTTRPTNPNEFPDGTIIVVVGS